MNVAESRGGWLRFDVHGEGEPVLMIMGLSGSRRAWHRLLPHVAAEHRAIVFDHRGTGDSDAVSGLQTMDDLVRDALAVLDAAGEESAHLVGVSMGGMVAQHLALDHRERVRSLVLGCTTAGGRTGAPPWRLLGATALRPIIGPSRIWPLIAPALYAQRTRDHGRARIEEDLLIRQEDSTATATSVAQMAAVARHDVRDRLHELAGLDVLVLHGEEDALVPVDRGRALAAGIPGSRLVTIPACGHLLTTDAEEAAAGAVLSHLRSVAGAATSPSRAA